MIKNRYSIPLGWYKKMQITAFLYILWSAIFIRVSQAENTRVKNDTWLKSF